MHMASFLQFAWEFDGLMGATNLRSPPGTSLDFIANQKK